MPGDLEWIDPSDLQADGVDHLDFGPRHPPPAWLSRATTWPRRVAHGGWLPVAAVAMIGALLFGPSVRFTHPTGHKPARTFTDQSCQVVIVGTDAQGQPIDVATGTPGQPITVATDGHTILIRKTQCGFAPTP